MNITENCSCILNASFFAWSLAHFLLPYTQKDFCKIPSSESAFKIYFIQSLYSLDAKFQNLNFCAPSMNAMNAIYIMKFL